MTMLPRLSLVLLMLLTSVALGMARGQVRAGGELVLCNGSAVVIVTTPGGDPGHAHYCPDMATGLLAALELPPVQIDRPAGSWQGAWPAITLVPAMADRPSPQARGPPPLRSG